MSAIGLVNIAQSISNQGATQGQDTQAVQTAANAAAPLQSAAVPEDQFTPSAQNGQSQASAQAAGLFSVPQSSLFSAAANVLLTQNTATQANPAAAVASATAPAPIASNTNVSAQQTAEVPAATTPAVPAAAQIAAPAVKENDVAAAAAAPNAQPTAATAPPAQAAAPAVATPATTTAAAPASAATTAATASLASAQEQLQALNLALEALGLSNQDIQQLDQIASIVNDYNPSAYTAQAYQLEALAQQTSPQASAAAAVNTAPSANNATAAAAKTTAAGGATGNV